jgi:hypothetical protein
MGGSHNHKSVLNLVTAAHSRFHYLATATLPAPPRSPVSTMTACSIDDITSSCIADPYHMPGTHTAPSDVPVLRRSDCTPAFIIFSAHVKLSTDRMQLISGAIAVSPQPATQPTAHACADRLHVTSTIRDTTLVQSSQAQPRRNRDRQLKAQTHYLYPTPQRAIVGPRRFHGRTPHSSPPPPSSPHNFRLP